MRFNLILHITGRNKVLPINYQYPQHSWIYRVIQSADAEFSHFLHEEGYVHGYKKFKLFTFSPLTSKPFKIFKEENRIGLYGEEVQLQISFLVNQAAEKFIMGLFMGQQFSLGDQISSVDFEVKRIEAQPRPVFQERMRYRCLSPVVLSVSEEGKAYAQYLHPEDERYASFFMRHLAQKQASVPQLTHADNNAWEVGCRSAGCPPANDWQFKLLSQPRKKGVHFKQHTPDHTQVIGYQYDFELTAPPEVHEMAYYAGFGEKNSLGFGMCGITKTYR
ncbi:CRISPR-associated endoribonuclease Cas6 [Catalinimonas niigatensis]|uniref:CRISPR-associated endoribonuclease Cas6 n=1 Tax=Catalinimonas niigatensis TaxID=1397264 RepID=UPI002665C044|nr:CRISPR-associated endoribonuclease Cas6 [Catalinimonas niigatensis]WPP51835.1 CRISPR-associated endoribonuclease Cas6 [Catalinimonas niigatensis]